MDICDARVFCPFHSVPMANQATDMGSFDAAGSILRPCPISIELTFENVFSGWFKNYQLKPVQEELHCLSSMLLGLAVRLCSTIEVVTQGIHLEFQ